MVLNLEKISEKNLPSQTGEGPLHWAVPFLYSHTRVSFGTGVKPGLVQLYWTIWSIS